jgi:hypothetical protein
MDGEGAWKRYFCDVNIKLFIMDKLLGGGGLSNLVLFMFSNFH